MKKILMLSANPKETSFLRLGEEVRKIQEALKLAKHRDQFEIVTFWAVRVEDLHRAMLEHEPHIVHFSGHGAGTESLAFEDNSGMTQFPPQPLICIIHGSEFQSQQQLHIGTK